MRDLNIQSQPMELCASPLLTISPTYCSFGRLQWELSNVRDGDGGTR